jgi:geranylgeranyl transferase type-2 subunit beta
MNFLSFLRDDLRAGLLLAPLEYQQKHAAWLRGRQCPEGGFANRRGEVDLYYTAFALRGLSGLNALTPEIALEALRYLRTLAKENDRSRIQQPHGCFSDAVMAVSWWDSLVLCEEVAGEALTIDEREEYIQATTQRMATLRRDDGGWSKGDQDAVGSLYHSFLGSCAFLRMGRPVPEAERAAALLKALTLDSGGFLENRYSKRPGTNGCAAAIGLALILGVEFDMQKQIDFIHEMASPEGGLYATPAAPIADLLSSYTGLFSLKMMTALDPLRTAKALGYARTLEQKDGGYTGFALETVVDCEYTFYGFGVESIAHNLARDLSAIG